MSRAPITVLGLVFILGCAVDADPEGEASSGGAAASTGSTQAETVTQSSDSSGGTTAVTTGPTGPKSCRRECQAAFDCCPAGLENCPSMAYPGNYGCSDEICVPASCAGDDECQAVLPGSSCVELGLVLQCVVLCEEDTACTAINAAMSCGPGTDPGKDYCSLRCDTNAIVCPAGCDENTGRCTCEGDDDCALGFRCV